MTEKELVRYCNKNTMVQCVVCPYLTECKRFERKYKTVPWDEREKDYTDEEL